MHAKASIPLRARPREWAGLAVIALPCLLYSMDLTVLNLALAHVEASMNHRRRGGFSCHLDGAEA
jgi:hypothetical protein